MKLLRKFFNSSLDAIQFLKAFIYCIFTTSRTQRAQLTSDCIATHRKAFEFCSDICRRCTCLLVLGLQNQKIISNSVEFFR